MNHTNLQMSYDPREQPQIVDRSDVTHCDLETKSILKPAKVRAPLQEVDLGLDSHIDFDVVRKRRVSFAGVNKIKEFNSKAESVIICSTPAYEETFSTSSDSSALTVSVVTINGGREAIDDCSLLNDTMDLTDIESDTKGANPIGITSQPKHCFSAQLLQSQGKEGPTNCENTDPNLRKQPERAKGLIGDIFGFGSGVQPTGQPPTSFLDPAKALIKEFLEDSSNDITVDMSLVGEHPHVPLRESKDRNNFEYGAVRSSVSGGASCLPVPSLGVKQPANIMDTSLMEITEQIPSNRASQIPAFNQSHSAMDFTQAASTKFPLQPANNFDPVAATNKEVSAVLKINMEFKMLQSNSHRTNPIIASRPTSYVDNNLDMCQDELSQMDITETIDEQSRLSYSQHISNPGVEQCIPFQPFVSAANTNMTPFEVDKSQMDFTQAISNNLKQPNSQPENNFLLRNNIPLHWVGSGVVTDRSMLEESKCHMELTEAVCSKDDLPHSQQVGKPNMQNNIRFSTFGQPIPNPSNPLQFNQSQMDFTEAVINKELPKGISCEHGSSFDINRSQMDFTEAINDKIELPIPQQTNCNSVQSELFVPAVHTNSGGFEVNKSQMDFTEVISHKIKLPPALPTNNCHVKGNALPRALDPDLNTSDMNKSEMDFTEALSANVNLLPRGLASNTVSQNNLPFNLFAKSAGLCTNLFDGNKSQMEMTEAIIGNVKFADLPPKNKPGIKTITPFDGAMNNNSFELNKSQMDFTEALCNKVQQPHPAPAIDPEIKNNTPFDAFDLKSANMIEFEVNKSGMDFTEAICNKAEPPHSASTVNPRIKNSTPFFGGPVNMDPFQLNNSQMELTEAVCINSKQIHPPKTMDSRVTHGSPFDVCSSVPHNIKAFEVDKSQMELTEAICIDVKQPRPIPSVNPRIKNSTSSSAFENKNTLEDNNPQMEFDGDGPICSDSNQPVINNSNSKNNLRSVIQNDSNVIDNRVENKLFPQENSWSGCVLRQVERIKPSISSNVLDDSPAMEVTDILKPQVLHSSRKIELGVGDPPLHATPPTPIAFDMSQQDQQCSHEKPVATDRIDKLDVNNSESCQEELPPGLPLPLSDLPHTETPSSEGTFKVELQSDKVSNSVKSVNANISDEFGGSGKVFRSMQEPNASDNFEKQLAGDSGFSEKNQATSTPERENEAVKGSCKGMDENDNSGMSISPHSNVQLSSNIPKPPHLSHTNDSRPNRMNNKQEVDEPMDCEEEIPSNKNLDNIEIKGEVGGKDLPIPYGVEAYGQLSNNSFNSASANLSTHRRDGENRETLPSQPGADRQQIESDREKTEEPPSKLKADSDSLHLIPPTAHRQSIYPSADRPTSDPGSHLTSGHRRGEARRTEWETKGQEEWNMIKTNRLFLKGMGLTYMSPTLWKYSFPWPTDLILRLPMTILDCYTKKIDIKLVKRKHRKDIVGELVERYILKNFSLILSESWLNSDCGCIKDLQIALELVMDEYSRLQTLITALRRLYSYYPIVIDEYRIGLEMVNINRKHIINIHINILDYKKLSGDCIKVTNILGGVREEDVQKAFDELVPNEDRLVNFVKAVNHLLASS